MPDITNDELIERAKSVLNPHKIGDYVVGDVGCALVTDRGNVYLGVCIDTGSGIGFCAEHSAIAAMVTSGEHRIKKIVAVWQDEKDTYILSPCGRCREFIRQIDPGNLDTKVILDRTKVCRLAELLPYADWFHKLEGRPSQEVHPQNTMPLPIETERLRLRQYQDGDAADIAAYSSEADFWLARNLDWEPTERGVRAYYEPRRGIQPESYPEWLSLVVELKAEGKVVGNVGIGVKNKEQGQAEVGWLLGRQYQGRGIATEAVRALLTFGFGPMGLHRIYARTGNRNVRSWRLMERVGMRREAHFRQSHKIEGEWDDEFVYALLADEWWQMQPE